MDRPWNRGLSAALLALEDRAASARGGFGCLFSTSDEYETALIAERRAQGRYGQQRNPWPIIMFVGCALMMAATVLLFG
jgi:hypothetical protein